jgi:hypothetical protein
MFTASAYVERADSERARQKSVAGKAPLIVSSSGVWVLLFVVGAILFLARNGKDGQLTNGEMSYETEANEVDIEKSESDSSDLTDWDPAWLAEELDSALEDDPMATLVVSRWDDELFASDDDELC